MGFCSGRSDVQVLPKNTSSASSPSSSSAAKDSGHSEKNKKQQGVKNEERKEKKRSNLDRAALTTPHFPFHSRPGLL
ncbi:uncharacterized protein [Triticum aestivum]|nr:uncharacterized protein LOC123066803 [Triticum aestivum]